MKKLFSIIMLITLSAHAGDSLPELQDMLEQVKNLETLHVPRVKELAVYEKLAACKRACAQALRATGQLALSSASYAATYAYNNPARAIAAAAVTGSSVYALRWLFKKSDAQILDAIAIKAGQMKAEVKVGKKVSKTLYVQFQCELQCGLQKVKSLQSASSDQSAMQKFNELNTKINAFDTAVSNYEKKTANCEKALDDEFNKLCTYINALKAELNPPCFIKKHCCKIAAGAVTVAAGIAGYIYKFGMPSWSAQK